MENPKIDGRPGTKKLSNSASNQRHIDNLAKRIMADPTFELLHETARKMHEKHFPNGKPGP